MPQRADTRSASKRATASKAARALAVPFAAGAVALGVAAPAAADNSSYVQALQSRYAFMSESELISAGNTVCANTRSGVPASNIIPTLVDHYGVSVSAAYEIIVNAINHLGC